jgi:uncharacterized small protein (DUF1192 family)
MATMPTTSARAADTSCRPGGPTSSARRRQRSGGGYGRPRSTGRVWAAIAGEQAGAWSLGDDAPTIGPPTSEACEAAEASKEVSGGGELDARQPVGAAGRGGLDRLDEAVTAAIDSDLDALSDAELAQRLDRLHRPIARLSAERARVTAELERRRVSTSSDPATREAVRRDLRRQLAERANSTPGDTKRDADAGRFADQHPLTGATFADGALSADHVRLIGNTLAALLPDRREAVEIELLAHARRTNPTQFGKHAREILAREAPTGSDRVARGQHRQRRVRSYDTPDGGFAFSGLLYGEMAETARVALDAFRRPDTPDEHRSPEQRSADAFEQLCAAALRVGEAPTRHGVRPHVIITMAADQLALGDRGVARFGSGQPATLRQLRTLLADCSWGRVLLGPDSTPIEASKSVRTVPAGLWRVLVARDAGCTWPGCDAPPAWCDVAHGAVPFADDGQLSPANAALLCRRHHRRFDLGGWQITIQGGTVHYHRGQEAPGQPPAIEEPARARTERSTTTPSGSSTRSLAGRPAGPPRGPSARTSTKPLAEGSTGPPIRRSARVEGEQAELPLPPALADP